jgi:acyl-CoA synthetase (AMP-forming)/AMP-acid ligase II
MNTWQWQDFVTVVRERARLTPNRVAITYLLDGEDARVELTFAELDRRARELAVALEAYAQRTALLLYPPSPEFVVGLLGCLYAGVIAVPTYPPEPNRLHVGVWRLKALAADAEAALVLTTADLLEHRGVVTAIEPALEPLRWIATDAPGSAPKHGYRPPALDRNSIALLQYTSGSTSLPKGVVITHGNILANCERNRQHYGLDAEQESVFWTPTFHDLGLIGGVLLQLYVGSHVTLFSPLHFIQRPARWLEAVSATRAYLSGAPNFAFDLCARKVTDAELERLDLSHWRVAFSGGEPVRADTLDRFAARFARCGFARAAFRPSYGLAEATLVVSSSVIDREPAVLSVDSAALREGRIRTSSAADPGAQRFVSCGVSLPGQELCVVAVEAGRACEEDTIGEIWVRGPNVAAGYWRRPADTLQTFGATLGEASGFLRTGDLGFLHGGELYVVGRIKDVIIVNGAQLYPQDVESTVEQSHPALRPGGCAAFAIDAEGTERVGVVQEVNDPSATDFRPVLAAIRSAVASAHRVEVGLIALIPPRTLPKTSSGKLQRRRTREALAERELPILSCWPALPVQATAR